MARQRSRKVWLAKISFRDRRDPQMALRLEQFPDVLRKALDPDKSVTYYREWRVSEPALDSAGETLSAQLGFRRRKRHELVDYDELEHVWFSEEAPVQQGNLALFVVDLRSQLMAFEDRGSDLNRDSFLNAFGRFLEPAGLEANLIADARSFEAWLGSVDRVTKFRVTLRQPNPGYVNRAKQVRELAGEIDHDKLTIEAESETGLNVKDTLLEGAAETAALGNGTFQATGVAGTRRRFFESIRQYLSGAIVVDALDSVDTVTSKIRDLMRDISPEVPDHDDDPPDE